MTRTEALLLAVRRVLESQRAHIDSSAVREITLTLKLSAAGAVTAALYRPTMEFSTRLVNDVANYKFQDAAELKVARSARDELDFLG